MFNWKSEKILVPAAILVTFAAVWVTGQGMPAITFDQTAPLPAVEFSHDFHLGQGVECADCHSGVFEMSVGGDRNGAPMMMSAMEEGRFCGTCHNGDTAFAVTECQNCHAAE
jgi:c(7)-type cytochrome triheme protein